MFEGIARDPVSDPQDESFVGAATRPRLTAASMFRGLLWAEWFAHSKLVLLFLCVWLVGVWLVPLFAHPGWILLLGGLYALIAGPVYGGGDILEGCEEFSFALPPTRGNRYIARLTVGGGTFLGLTSFNLLTLGFDLPQVLARLYIDTGIVEPLPNLSLGLLSGLVVALPLAAFALSFAISAVTHSRWLVLTAWFWGGLAALTVLQLGFWYEELVWGYLTGDFSCPLLIGSACAGLMAGYFFYRRKEIGMPSVPLTLPGRFWVWLSLFLIGTGVGVTLIASIAKLVRQLLDAGGSD
ncbi:MAG: hypothetical protein O2960_09285 [Verrucomicrobia bacterium]|nr:hypothetical protein [Verrucomicrobiota bacterium]